MSGGWLPVGAVLAATSALFAGMHWLGRRFPLHPEVRRKVLHVGGGLLGLSFPWLFDSFWPVATICAVALGALILIRVVPSLRESVGSDIHGVGRRSLGDFVVPVAVASLFLLADGDPLLYVVPLLLLTLADASAALVAIRYGLSPYPTLDGEKTFEGTTVFFAVASWATLVPLALLTDIGREELLLVTLIVALIGSLIEAVSWSGLDNVFVPWGTFFVLRRSLRMDSSELLLELVVLAALAVTVFLGARRSRMTVQARFLALLSTFVVWALVGWHWIAPAAMLVVLHPALVPVPEERPAPVDLRAVVSVATCAVWALLEQVGVAYLERNFYAYCVGLAAHLVLVCDARRRSARLPRSRIDAVRFAFVATPAVAGWYFLDAGFTRESLLLVGLALPVVLVTGYVFACVPVRRSTSRSWAVQAYFGLQASAIAFVVHSLVSVQP